MALGIKSKIVVLTWTLVVASASVLTIGSGVKASQFGSDVKKISNETAQANLSDQTKAIVAMVSAQGESVQSAVDAQLSSLDAIVVEKGVSYSSKPLNWTATNQVTKEKSNVLLPALRLGNGELGQVSDRNQRVDAVDRISDTSGAAATIFQKMNDSNDMLRVATSVVTAEGKRAIGTYIPATVDGKPNPVISTVMSGNTYRGVALVVDRQYIVSYGPLRDSSSNIIGMTFAGLPQDSSKTMRAAIQGAKVGKKGYASVIGASGDSRGRVIMSGGGVPDKSNMLELKDAKGNQYVEKLLQEAVTLSDGNTLSREFSFKSNLNGKLNNNLITVGYYKPWNWVIVTSLPMSEVKATGAVVDNELGKMVGVLVVLGVIVAIIGVVIGWKFGVRLAANLRKGGYAISQSVDTFCEVNEQLANVVASTNTQATHLAQDSEEASGNVQTVASSATEMQASVNEIAQNASMVSAEATRAVALAGDASETANQLNASSVEIGSILTTISSIAEQTNLLALNATIEAARAGDAGKGFAVVANEVKELAGQTGTATEEISERVGAIQHDTAKAVQAIEEVSRVINEINDSQATIASAIEEQSATASGVAEAMSEASLSLHRISEASHVILSDVEHTSESLAASQDAVQTLQSASTNLDELIEGRPKQLATASAYGASHMDDVGAPSGRGDRFGMSRVAENENEYAWRAGESSLKS